MMKFFVLGGNDLEMVTIRALLGMAGQMFIQPNKEWGNHSYSPQDLGVTRKKYELKDHSPDAGVWYEYRKGEFLLSALVCVECQPSGWESSYRHGHLFNTVVVDHHGDLSYRSAAILQILSILEKDGFRISDSTRRWVELVAANDAGYIPAMMSIGATPDEIARVRAADRAAQGITVSQETEAERAIKAADRLENGLVVVRLEHSKCSTVADRLFDTWPDGRENLLILSGDGEVNFFGNGALCAKLSERFGGWSGGAGLGTMTGSGYWGHSAPIDQAAVEAAVREFYSPRVL